MATRNPKPETIMSSYVPLWCKSNFSFLEGASHPEELIEEAYRLCRRINQRYLIAYRHCERIPRMEV
jgi:hypothetical protein